MEKNMDANTGGYYRVILRLAKLREAFVVKNPPANAGHANSTPGSGRFPGEGTGNPLQYSCVENPMDRGAWCVTVPGVTKSQT